MTKSDVILLCNHSEHLSYMAVVMFAELYELAFKNSQVRDDTNFLALKARANADEFDWHVIQEQLRQVKEKETEASPNSAVP